MAISNDTLYTDMWTAVKDVIVAAAPTQTNSSTSATTAASVRAAYNDQATTKPQIVVYPISMDEDRYKFGSDSFSGDGKS